ncbi:MAG: hypothetical protein GX196_03430 [Clostridiaceae bacterium]|nr:hypothetical protein [Clostridiaceae bacterium]
MIEKFLQNLSKMDPAKLKEGVKMAEEFAKTKEGQEILKSLKNKDELLKTIKKINPQNGISPDERDKLINELMDNPEIVKKISKYLK